MKKNIDLDKFTAQQTEIINKALGKPARAIRDIMKIIRTLLHSKQGKYDEDGKLYVNIYVEDSSAEDVAKMQHAWQFLNDDDKLKVITVLQTESAQIINGIFIQVYGQEVGETIERNDTFRALYPDPITSFDLLNKTGEIIENTFQENSQWREKYNQILTSHFYDTYCQNVQSIKELQTAMSQSKEGIEIQANLQQINNEVLQKTYANAKECIAEQASIDEVIELLSLIVIELAIQYKAMIPKEHLQTPGAISMYHHMLHTNAGSIISGLLIDYCTAIHLFDDDLTKLTEHELVYGQLSIEKIKDVEEKRKLRIAKVVSSLDTIDEIIYALDRKIKRPGHHIVFGKDLVEIVKIARDAVVHYSTFVEEALIPRVFELDEEAAPENLAKPNIANIESIYLPNQTEITDSIAEADAEVTVYHVKFDQNNNALIRLEYAADVLDTTGITRAEMPNWNSELCIPRTILPIVETSAVHANNKIVPLAEHKKITAKRVIHSAAINFSIVFPEKVPKSAFCVFTSTNVAILIHKDDKEVPMQPLESTVALDDAAAAIHELFLQLKQRGFTIGNPDEYIVIWSASSVNIAPEIPENTNALLSEVAKILQEKRRWSDRDVQIMFNKAGIKIASSKSKHWKVTDVEGRVYTLCSAQLKDETWPNSMLKEVFSHVGNTQLLLEYLQSATHK